uniref:Uncharacterized protein n=1 Tax=Arundo donax TaxID=35708 RepID=A0A0A9CID9_ARUDO
MYENSHETASAEVYETGTPKRPASWSRNSLVTLASSSSRSSSSVSIEENELPVQLQSLRPDDCETSTSQKISTSQAGSTSPAPMRSLSMMDLHRLHRSSSSIRLKDKKVD